MNMTLGVDSLYDSIAMTFSRSCLPVSERKVVLNWYIYGTVFVHSVAVELRLKVVHKTPRNQVLKLPFHFGFLVDFRSSQVEIYRR